MSAGHFFGYLHFDLPSIVNWRPPGDFVIFEYGTYFKNDTGYRWKAIAITDDLSDEQGDGAAWLVTYMLFWNGIPSAEMKYRLDNVGTALLETISIVDDFFEPTEEMADRFFAYFYPVLLSTSFLHCKNVEVVDRPPSRQVRRAAERKGKKAITYKTLDIELFKAQVRQETQPGENQIARALHICRGHFKTFTDKAPLMGQHVGTYWWGAHLRGSKANGEVKKDYKVVVDGNT